jgi:hypothetical protein
MKKINLALGLSILLCGMPCLVHANNDHLFTLKVSSDTPQAFFGTYFTDNGLTVVNETTPFEIQAKSNQMQAMLSAKDTKALIQVTLIKKTAKKPLDTMGKGHSVVICGSYEDKEDHHQNLCEASVRTGN